MEKINLHKNEMYINHMGLTSVIIMGGDKGAT